MYSIASQSQSIYIKPNPLVDSFADVEFVRPKIPSKLQTPQYFSYASQMFDQEQKQLSKTQQFGYKQPDLNQKKPKFIKNFQFSARNFGSVCDKMFMSSTSYHYKQKFGKKSILNSIIDQNSSQNNISIQQSKSSTIEADQFLTCPEDKRITYKIVHKLPHFGMILQFNSLQIQVRNDNKSKGFSEKKILKTFMVCFSDLIALINLHSTEGIIETVKKALEYNQLTGQIELQLKEILEFEKNQQFASREDVVFPENTQSYFTLKGLNQKVMVAFKFPKISFYVNQFIYDQQFYLNSREISRLIYTNFQNFNLYLQNFNFNELRAFLAKNQNDQVISEFKMPQQLNSLKKKKP